MVIFDAANSEFLTIIVLITNPYGKELVMIGCFQLRNSIHERKGLDNYEKIRLYVVFTTSNVSNREYSVSKNFIQFKNKGNSPKGE